MFSKLFTLNTLDFIKGAVVSVSTAILTVLINILNTGAFPDAAGMKAVYIAGVSALGAYLLKQLSTNSSGQFAKPEAKQ